MPNLSIATIFGEDIERLWRGVVPRECVSQLRLMCEQLLIMEKAINTQQRLIEKLLQFAVLEGNALKEIKAMQKQLAALDNSLVNVEKIDDN